MYAWWLQSVKAFHWEKLMKRRGRRRWDASLPLLLLCGELSRHPPPPTGRIWLQRNPVTSRPSSCRGYAFDEKMGVASRAPRDPYIWAGWLAQSGHSLSGARSVELCTPEQDTKSAVTDCKRITEELLLLFYFSSSCFCWIFVSRAPNMAMTEAGCDLTYCKMRGIVTVLTGELLKHYNYPNS